MPDLFDYFRPSQYTASPGQMQGPPNPQYLTGLDWLRNQFELPTRQLRSAPATKSRLFSDYLHYKIHAAEEQIRALRDEKGASPQQLAPIRQRLAILYNQAAKVQGKSAPFGQRSVPRALLQQTHARSNRRGDIGIPGTVATVTGAIVQSAAHLFGYSGPDPQEWGRNVQRGSDEWQTSNNEQWEQLANLRRRAFPHGLFLNTRAGQAMKSSQDPEMRRVYYMLQSLDPAQQIDMMAAITRKHGGRRTLSEFSGLLKKAISGDPESQDQVMGMVYAGVAGIATEHLLPLVGEGLGVRGPRLGLRGDVPESRGLRPSARQERASAGSAGTPDSLFAQWKVQRYVNRANGLMTKLGREKGFQVFVNEVRREHGFTMPLPDAGAGRMSVDALVKQRGLTAQQIRQLRAEAEAAAAEGARVKPQFDRQVDQIAASFGAKTKHGPIKTPDRILAKVLTRKDLDVGGVKDIVRSTIVAPDYASAGKIVAEIEKSMRRVVVKNRFLEPTDSGFRDYLLNVELPNGRIGEIQVHVPEMYDVKDGLSHDLYEMGSALNHRGEYAVADILARMAKRIHDEAWRKVKK